MLDRIRCPSTGFALTPISEDGSAADLVACLWRPRHLLSLQWPRLAPVSLATYSSLMAEAGAVLHRSLFDHVDGDATRDAIFLWRRHIYATFNDSNMPGLYAPAGTMELFDDALSRGVISSVAWSAAVRLCYLDYISSDAFDGSRVRRFIEPLSTADPRGLMTASERDHVETLPHTVTLYRTALTRSAAIAGEGISWTSTPDYIDKHIEHTDEVARTNGSSEVTYSRAAGWQHRGRRQWVVEARFPRAAVCAWIEPHRHEYLVDYRQVVPGSLRSIPVHQPYPSIAAIEAAERYIAEFA